MEKEIILYSKPNCTACRMVKDLFDRNGVEYEYKDTSVDEAYKEEVRGYGYMTVPITVIGIRVVDGWRPDLFEQYLGIK